MDTKKFITGTLVGGISYFILGYLFYGLLLAGFFEANAGSAAAEIGRQPEEMVWWALILGNFTFAALITLIFIKWAHISTFKGGFKAGAAIGLLIALSYDLIMHATTHMMNLTAVAADVVVSTLITAIIGGLIGAILHAKPQREPATV